MSILTKESNKHASYLKCWLFKLPTVFIIYYPYFATKVQTLLAALFERPPLYVVKVLYTKSTISALRFIKCASFMWQSIARRQRIESPGSYLPTFDK
jgi:hypothetical protein